jgi:hypothetical protein
MREPSVVLVSLVLVLFVAAAGCGTGGTVRAGPAPPAFPRPQGCSSLTVRDVNRVSPFKVESRDLAHGQHEHIACSTMFFGGPGDIVVVISERIGGEKTLNSIRDADAAQFGATQVQSVAGLGPGAFVARQRILAFRRRQRVVVLETGYSSASHAPVLGVAQLEQLARVVSGRL